MELKEIAVIHTDFPEKFGIPRQSGLVGGLQGTIVFSPEYRNADAIRGLMTSPTSGLYGDFPKQKRSLVCHRQTAAARWKSAYGYFCNTLPFPS
ncbi:MAG: hypothetical protein ACLSFA_06275 [Roseburia inulinivorans]